MTESCVWVLISIDISIEVTMAHFLSSTSVFLHDDSTASVCSHFRVKKLVLVMHCHEKPFCHSATRGFSFFLEASSGRLICTQAGLKGGGTGKSKPVVKEDTSSKTAGTDNEARAALSSLSSTLDGKNAAKLISLANILQQNSCSSDSSLILLIIPKLTESPLFSLPGNDGFEARLSVAHLLRTSCVRHAVRHRRISGFSATQQKELTLKLQQQLKLMEKLDFDRQEVDLQAELHGSCAIMSSLGSEFWSNIETLLPDLGNFRSNSDPIEVVAHLTDKLQDLSIQTGVSYKKARRGNELVVIMMLSVMHHSRKFLSVKDVEVLQVASEKCQVWSVAVLLIRLVADCLEEATLQLNVRVELVKLLKRYLSFRTCFLRHHWKVRKSALHNLLKVQLHHKQDREIDGLLTALISERRSLECDSKVTSAFSHFERMGSQISPLPLSKQLQDSAGKELRDLCSNIKYLYSTMHAKDESRVHLVAQEIGNTFGSMHHLVTLAGNTVSDIKELIEDAVVASRRIGAISQAIKSPGETDVGSPGRDFVGRNDEIQDLISQFQRPQTQVGILGPPGIGKTALAQKCVSALSELSLFDQFIWINAQNSITIVASFSTVDTETSDTCDCSQKWRNIKERLTADLRVLLIYDNADFEELFGSQEIDSFVTEHFNPVKASSLILSRNSAWRRILTNVISLGPLPETAALEMLVSISTMRKDQISSKVLKLLAGNPMSLTLVGNYLKYAKSTDWLEQKLPEEPTFEKLVGICMKDANVQSKATLELLSMLNPEGIPANLSLEITRNDGIASLKSIAAELESISAIQITAVGDIKLHRVIQEVAFQLSDRKFLLEEVISNALVQHIVDIRIEDLLQCRYYHSLRTNNTFNNFLIDQAILTFCLKSGLRTEALVISRRSLPLPDLSNEEKRAFLLRQADACELTGNEAKAEEFYTQAYMLSIPDPDTRFMVAFKLTKLAGKRVDTSTAKRYIEEVLSLLPGLNLTPERQFEVYHTAAQILSNFTTECFALYLKAQDLAIDCKSLESQLELQVEIAEAHLTHHHEEMCINQLTAILRRLTSSSDSSLVTRVFVCLARTNASQGPFRLEILRKEMEFRRDNLLRDKKRLVELLAEISALLGVVEIERLGKVYYSEESNPVWNKESITIIQPKYFRLFDCRHMALSAKVRLSATIKADHLSSHIVLSDGSIFLCGGGEYKAIYDSTYRLLPNGTVQVLSRMCKARQAHGIIECNGQVFVFGGETMKHESLSSSEKFGLRQSTWTKVGNMCSGRSCFNPCLYDSLIYLIGGNTNSAETFDPETSLFRPIQLRLPESEDTCTVLQSSELIIISSNFVCSWNFRDALTTKKREGWVEEGKKWDEAEQEWSTETLYIGSMNGLIVDKFVFISVYDHLRIFDLNNVREHVILMQ